MRYYIWCHGAAPQLGVGTVNELYCLLGLGFLCFGLWFFFPPSRHGFCYLSVRRLLRGMTGPMALQSATSLCCCVQL